MVSTAFKPVSELFLFPPRFFVVNPTLINFQGSAAHNRHFMRTFFTLYREQCDLSTGIVFGGVFISAMAAYPLAKHNMPFKKFIFDMVVAH